MGWFFQRQKMTGEAVKKCLEHLIEFMSVQGSLIDTITAEGRNDYHQNYRTKTNASELFKVILTAVSLCGGRDYRSWNRGRDRAVYRRISGIREQLIVKIRNTGMGSLDLASQCVPFQTVIPLPWRCSREIDAAYGMPYASYPLFENEDYTFSSCATSRAFFAHMNFASPVIQDAAVRAIAMGIDKEGFVATC